MSVIVRPAEQKDLNDLTSIMHEYIFDFYQRPKPPVGKMHELIQLLLNKKEGIQFVAEQDGKLVGFATLYFSYSTLRANKVAIMNDLYVIEERRGTGVASDLFRRCESFTKENGYSYMSWVTASDNQRAQHFYEKMGGLEGEWVSYSI